MKKEEKGGMIRAKRKANRNVSAKKYIKVFALIMTVKIIIARECWTVSR